MTIFSRLLLREAHKLLFKFDVDPVKPIDSRYSNVQHTS